MTNQEIQSIKDIEAYLKKTLLTMPAFLVHGFTFITNMAKSKEAQNEIKIINDDLAELSKEMEVIDLIDLFLIQFFFPQTIFETNYPITISDLEILTEYGLLSDETEIEFLKENIKN